MSGQIEPGAQVAQLVMTVVPVESVGGSVLVEN